MSHNSDRAEEKPALMLGLHEEEDSFSAPMVRSFRQTGTLRGVST